MKLRAVTALVALVALVALAALKLPAAAHARPDAPNMKEGKGRIKVHRDPRLRVVRPYRAWLASTRACESGGRYGIATGNGFYGAYQFTVSSWRAVGGWGMPHRASRLEQDYRAVRLLHVQGVGAWPVCG
jgi:hypothetical protein